MRLQLKKCRTCKALGVGPRAIKLYPLDDQLYCEQGTPKDPGCYRQALHWHESRPNIIMALMFDVAKPIKQKKYLALDWKTYIWDCAEMAAWALEHDRRIFTHYFSRAMYAWTLKEMRR